MNLTPTNPKRKTPIDPRTKQTLSLTLAVLYLIPQLAPMALASPSLYARPGAGVSDLPIEVLAFNTPGFGDVQDAVNLATGNVYVDTGSLARNNVLDPAKPQDEKQDKTMAVNASLKGNNWVLKSRLRLDGYNGLLLDSDIRNPRNIYSGDGSGTAYQWTFLSNLIDSNTNLPSWIRRYKNLKQYDPNNTAADTAAEANLVIYTSKSTPGLQVPEEFLVFVKTVVRGAPYWVAHLYDHSGNRSTFFNADDAFNQSYVDFRQNLNQQYVGAKNNNDPEGIGASPKTEITYHSAADFNVPGLINKVKDQWGRVTTLTWGRFQGVSTEPPVLYSIQELLQVETQPNSWTRQTRFAYVKVGTAPSQQLVVQKVSFIAQNGLTAADPAAVEAAGICGTPTDLKGIKVCNLSTFELGTASSGGYVARTFEFSYTPQGGHVLLTGMKRPILRDSRLSTTTLYEEYTYKYDTSTFPRITSFTSNTGESITYTYTNNASLYGGLKITVVDGPQTSAYHLDTSGQVRQHDVIDTNPANSITRTLSWKYQYHSNGYTAAVTEPTGATTVYGYDQRGNQISETRYPSEVVLVKQAITSPMEINPVNFGNSTYYCPYYPYLTACPTPTTLKVNTSFTTGSTKWNAVGPINTSSPISNEFSFDTTNTPGSFLITASDVSTGLSASISFDVRSAYSDKYVILNVKKTLSALPLSADLNPKAGSNYTSRTESTYDADNRVTKNISISSTDGTYNYKPSGNTISYSDDTYAIPATAYSTDPSKNQEFKVLLSTETLTGTFDAAGTLTTLNPLKNTTEFDIHGRVTKSTTGSKNTLLRTTQYTYPGSALVPQLRVSVGGVVSYPTGTVDQIIQYADQVLTINDGLKTTEFKYDALGNAHSVRTTAGTQGVVTSINKTVSASGTVVTPLYSSVLQRTNHNGFGQQLWSQTEQEGNNAAILTKGGSVFASSGEKLSDWTGAISNVTQYYYSTLGSALGKVAEIREGTGDGTAAIRDMTIFRSTFIQYDTYGRVSKKAVDGFHTTYQYDTLDRPVVETNYLSETGRVDLTPTGKYGQTLTRYHLSGQPERITETIQGTRPSGGDVNSTAITEYTLDAYGQVVTTKYPDGGIVHQTFDGYGRVVRIEDTRLSEININSGGQTTYMSYDSLGRLRQILKPALRSKALGSYSDGRSPYVEYQYDEFGRKTHDHELIGNSFIPSVALNGQSANLGVEHLKTNETRYDNWDRVIETINTRGYSTKLTLDMAGNAWKMDQEVYKNNEAGAGYAYPTSGRIVIYQSFDGLGREYQSIDGRGYERRKTYNDLGNVTAEIEPNEDGTLIVRKMYTYTANGMLSSVYEPDSAVIRTPGMFGAPPTITKLSPLPTNITSVIWNSDPTKVSNMFMMERHSYGSRLFPVSTYRAYKDSSAATAEATVTHYTYNKDGLPLTETVVTSEPGATQATAVSTMSYDSQGMLIYKQHNDGFVQIDKYDVMGRKIQDGSSNPVATFTYDLMGNVKTKTTDHTVTTHYNSLGLPIRTEGYSSETRWYGYRPDGSKIYEANGAFNGNLANAFTLSALKTGQTQGSLKYFTLDKSGLALTEQLDAEYTRTHSYDGLGRRIREVFSGDASVYEESSADRSFYYDENGNAVKIGSVTYTYNAINKAVTDSNNSSVRGKYNDRQQEVTNYTYYLDGKTKTSGTKEMSYDRLGRIVNDGSISISYSPNTVIYTDSKPITPSYSYNNSTGTPKTISAVKSITEKYTNRKLISKDTKTEMQVPYQNDVGSWGYNTMFSYSTEEYFDSVTKIKSCSERLYASPEEKCSYYTAEQDGKYTFTTIVNQKTDGQIQKTDTYVSRRNTPDYISYNGTAYIDYSSQTPETSLTNEFNTSGAIVKTSLIDNKQPLPNSRAYTRTYTVTPSGKRTSMTITGNLTEFSFFAPGEGEPGNGDFVSYNLGHQICNKSDSLTLSKRYKSNEEVSSINYSISKEYRDRTDGSESFNGSCTVVGKYTFSYDNLGNQILAEFSKTFDGWQDSVSYPDKPTVYRKETLNEHYKNVYFNGELLSSETRSSYGLNRVERYNDSQWPLPSVLESETRNLGWTALESSISQVLVAPFVAKPQKEDYKDPTPSSSVGLTSSSVNAPQSTQNPFTGGTDVAPPQDTITQNATGVMNFSNPLDNQNPDNLFPKPEPQPIDPNEYGPPTSLADTNPHAVNATNVQDQSTLNSSGSLGLGDATLPGTELNPNLTGSSGSSGVVAPGAELNPNLGGSGGNAGGNSGSSPEVISPDGPPQVTTEGVVSYATATTYVGAEQCFKLTGHDLKDAEVQELCENYAKLGEKLATDEKAAEAFDLINQIGAKYGPGAFMDALLVMNTIRGADTTVRNMFQSELATLFKDGKLSRARLSEYADRAKKYRAAQGKTETAITAATFFGGMFIDAHGSEIASTIADFVPGISNIKAVYESVTGRDMFSGENLGWLMRGLALGGVVGGAAYAAIKNAKKAEQYSHLIASLKGFGNGISTLVKEGWNKSKAFVKKYSKYFKKCKTSCGCSVNSFTPETPVWTKYGLTAIAALAVGTPVLAFNEQTGEQGYYPITQIFENQDPFITGLVIEDPESKALEYITTTPEHPFYVTERSDGEPRPKPEGHLDLSDKWVGAGHLKVGDKLKQADGTLGEVRYVNTIQEARTMYNLEVEEAHTFFVGTQGWLVHNTGECFFEYVYDPKTGKYVARPAPYSDEAIEARRAQFNNDFGGQDFNEELYDMANSIKGQSSGKARTMLETMARKAGLKVVEGAKHNKVVDPVNGNVITLIPHSPKPNTASGAAQNILKYSGGKP